MRETTLQRPSGSATSGAIVLDDGQLGQLAYHVRWSAALAAQGQVDSATQHAIIADALLEVLGGEALRAAGSALDLPDVVATPASPATTIQRGAATELCFQFVSHFTSDGRHDLADLYLEATRRIAR